MLMSLTIAVSIFAGEVPKVVRTTSPDGVFQVRVVKMADANRRRLEIIRKDGNTLYISPPQIDGTDILDFYEDRLRWSPDSRILAISAGYPKLFRTCLFAWDGKSFHQIAMPEIAEGEDNPWIYPTEWRDNHILHLQISGPHAGRASDNGYEGTAVVQVDLQTMTSKKLSEKVSPVDQKNRRAGSGLRD